MGGRSLLKSVSGSWRPRKVQLGTEGSASHYGSSFTKTPMLASCCQPNSSVDPMTSATGVATEEFSGYFKATRSPSCRRPWTEAYVGQEPLASQLLSPRLIRELLGGRLDRSGRLVAAFRASLALATRKGTGSSKRTSSGRVR